MKRRAVAMVVIQPSGKLLVCPEVEDEFFYEYIYREANGLRWDRHARALCAQEPSRWGHEELLQHIAATLRNCCDEELFINEGTRWIGVPLDLQDAFRKVLVQ